MSRIGQNIVEGEESPSGSESLNMKGPTFVAPWTLKSSLAATGALLATFRFTVAIFDQLLKLSLHL